MKSLNLPLETIKLIGISPTSYCILQLLSLEESISEILYTQEDIDSLYSMKFLDAFGGITPLGRSLFTASNNEQNWEEFKSLYPISAGHRRLHDKIDRCKQKYISYLREGIPHKDIIKGLENEIQARENAVFLNEFMPAWKSMSTYLNNKSWVDYSDMEKQNIIIDDGNQI